MNRVDLGPRQTEDWQTTHTSNFRQHPRSYSSSMLWTMVYHHLLQIVAIVIMIVSLLIISLCFSESLRCQLPTSLLRRQVKECNHRDCLRIIDSRGLSHVARKLTIVDDASDDLNSDAALMAKILAAEDNNVFMRYSGHANIISWQPATVGILFHTVNHNLSRCTSSLHTAQPQLLQALWYIEFFTSCWVLRLICLA